MTTYATYQGIPIFIEVHVLPHSHGATYGILFAKLDPFNGEWFMLT